MQERRGNPLLKMENVSFGYNRNNYIIMNLSVDIPYKNIGIIGENGIGKTTILNLIDKKFHYEGNISIDGSVYFPKDLFEKYSRLTVEEFTALITYLREFDSCYLAECLTVLKLEKYLSYEIGSLSKGTRKKLSILLALLSKSSTILLDEPFESIDRESNLNFSRVIKNKDNNFIIVSHDIEYLKLSTDKIYELRDGKLYEQ